MIITLICYYLIPSKKFLFRNSVLLAANYIFYSTYGWKLLLLIIGMSFMSYVFAILIQERKIISKLLLKAGILICIFVLFIFKYYNFFGSYAVKLVNEILSSNLEFSLLNIGLSVGVSFYTFEIISYLVDVCNEKIAAERNLVYYFLYLSFFPKVLSGPIERAGHFLPQLKTEHKFEWDNINNGFKVFLFGLFKKIALADRLSIFVNAVFDNIYSFSGVTIILAVLAFTIQIYCDFSGYSDMAIGIAKMLGFELSNNFDVPYFSPSIKEFWRRWHITLSSWLRDYIYIPLGGSRVTAARTRINLLVTFVVSGLWHGANWTYVLWGLVHGIFQIIETLIFPKGNSKNFFINVVRRIITFIAVAFAWIFFRANSIQDLKYILYSMLVFNGQKFKDELLLLEQSDINIYYLLAALVLILVLVVNDYICYIKGTHWFININNKYVEYLWVFIMIFLIIILGIYGPMYEASTFIYFKF